MRLRFLFARHGATAANLAGLRCGGDVDPPLVAEGRRQAERLAQAVAASGLEVRWIITSDLLRTHQTAQIVRSVLGSVELRIVAGLRERRLGRWNFRTIAETEAAMAAGQTPPGGESRAEFARRIDAALGEIAADLVRPALIVASKGVGRVLRERSGMQTAPPLANGEWIELHLPWPAVHAQLEVQP